MRFETRLTQQLGIELPVLQALMAGGGDTAALVAAVSNAGGVGSIGAAYLRPEPILERARAVRDLTDKPFGINLLSPLPVPVRMGRRQGAAELMRRLADELLRTLEELGSLRLPRQQTSPPRAIVPR